MPLLIASMKRAVSSLLIPGMLTVALWSILLALAVLAALAVALVAGFDWWLGAAYPGSEWGVWLAGAGSVILAWFLFPGIMPVIVNFFDAHIAGLIERHDYPKHRPARDMPFMPELWHDVRFSLMAVTLNILIIPLYFVPIINLFIFYLLNGWLLGREFFVMAARRHMPISDAVALRRRNGRIVTLAGMALALLATVPFVNLLAPFWGIALMTHLFHGLGTPQSALPAR